MTKFAVFAGSTYYPSGGWDDWRGTFDTMEEAKAFIKDKVSAEGMYDKEFDWAHIVSLLFSTITESYP